MLVHNRTAPPVVEQLWECSCWAADMESWSLVDPRLKIDGSKMGVAVDLQTDVIEQEALANAWGQGDKKGISGEAKMRKIKSAMNIRIGGYRGNELEAYLTQYLPSSHVLCSYNEGGGFAHAVLIYRMNADGCTYMDPDTCKYWTCNWQWFANRGPLTLMSLK